MDELAQGCFNWVGPFSVVMEYGINDYTGFYVKAHNKEVPTGWGDPHFADDGTPIEPGTPGGANAVQYVTKYPKKSPTSGGGWKTRYVPGKQLYGEVDWAGDWISEDEATGGHKRGRHRLSFHGPVSRVFPNEKFGGYGTSDTHNNVYYRGKLLTVAPHAVMGAALKMSQGEDGRPVWHVYVACYRNGLTTAFYKRRVLLSTAIYMDKFSDKWRAAQMRTAGEPGEDYWHLLGTHADTSVQQGTSATLLPMRTPWFFNKSCTQAAQMKECDIRYNLVIRGTIENQEVTRRGHALYTATISDESVTVSSGGNTEGFVITLETSFKQREDLNVTCQLSSDAPVMPHSWLAWEYVQKVKIDGEYKVAVDFKEDELIVVSVKAAVRRQMIQWWYQGNDHDKYGYPYDTEDPDSLFPWSNNRYRYSPQRGGDAYGKSDTFSLPGDGRSNKWLGILDDIKLSWTVAGKKQDATLVYRESGSYDEYLGNPPSLTNNLYYFTWEYIHHFMHLQPGTNHAVMKNTEKIRANQDADGTSEVYDTTDKQTYEHWTGGEKAFIFCENDEKTRKVPSGFGYLNYMNLLKDEQNWPDTMNSVDELRSFDCDLSVLDLVLPRMDGGKLAIPHPVSFLEYGITTESGQLYGDWKPVSQYYASKETASFVEGLGAGSTDDDKYVCTVGYIKRDDKGDKERFYNVVCEAQGVGRVELNGLVIPTIKVTDEDQPKFFPIGVK